MGVEQLMLSLPEGCEIWRIDTSFVGKQCILITPANNKFHLSRKATDICAQIVEQRKSLGDIASALTEQWNTPVSAEDVLAIVESSHWPKNLLRKSYPWETDDDLSQSVEERSENALFARYYFRFTLLSGPLVLKIGKVLGWLYRFEVVLLFLLATTLVHYGVYSYVAAHDSLARPATLSPGEYVFAFILVFITVLFHEFGHATASVIYGVKPGGIGCGIYLIYPSLYTELGFAWLLPRKRRAVIDVGGFYFQLIAVIPLYLIFLLTDNPVYIVVILAADALIILSLIPFFKFDGYWLLADLLGVPNLQKRAMEMVRKPFRVFGRGHLVTKSGLTLKRGVAITVLVYGLLFLVFQVMFAMMIFRSGIAFIFETPAELFKLAAAAITDLRAGLLSDMSYQLLRAFMQIVLAISLILILKSYAVLFWRMGRRAFLWGREKLDAGGKCSPIQQEEESR